MVEWFESSTHSNDHRALFRVSPKIGLAGTLINNTHVDVSIQMLDVALTVLHNKLTYSSYLASCSITSA